MLFALLGLLVGISVGSMQVYYLMTKDFFGSIILMFIWPYVMFLFIRRDLLAVKGKK